MDAGRHPHPVALHSPFSSYICPEHGGAPQVGSSCFLGQASRSCSCPPEPWLSYVLALIHWAAREDAKYTSEHLPSQLLCSFKPVLAPCTFLLMLYQAWLCPAFISALSFY